MIGNFRKAWDSLRPQFHRRIDEHLNPYYTFKDYRRIWGVLIIILVISALGPLIVVTITHNRLLQKSVDWELLARTERVASNARRAVSFFLEEHLDALQFTVSEHGYEQLTRPDALSDILRNLKLGFGGLTDLSVIDHTGTQVVYAGPFFELQGRNYSGQPWFMECQKHNFYVSEIFRGYRDVPHIVIAVKSLRDDGLFYILRATLETEQIIKILSSHESGDYSDIFLLSRTGIIQTPSKNYGDIFKKMSLPLPEYSPRTHAVISKDNKRSPIMMGYAYISTQNADTPFIIMVIKQKAGMVQVWHELRTNMNWFVGLCILVILIVAIFTCTFMVNRLYIADKAKAETMALMEQNNQLAAIGQLAAGVAHEINNPLALINETAGYVKDLFTIKEQYNKDEELLENVDYILDAVGRCGRITRQLLRFAKKFDVKIEKVNLKELISDVLVFHIKEAEYRNIQVLVDVSEDTPCIETDRGKLQQILMNLVNNAFQAVDSGSIVDIRASNDGPDRIRITISDNGCGMSEEDLSKIFEPFFTKKQGERGTGLGLAITFGLVQKLHGDISAKSKEKVGTTFTIILPNRIPKEKRDDEGSIG